MTRKRRHQARIDSESVSRFVVLDSGGLSGLMGRSQRARALLRWVVEQGGSVLVPTPVLAETITGDGARDAETNRVLGVLCRTGVGLRSPDEATARLAGRLRYEADGDDAIDALVAAAAARAGGRAVLITSDPGDLSRLLAGVPTVAVRGA